MRLCTVLLFVLESLLRFLLLAVCVCVCFYIRPSACALHIYIYIYMRLSTKCSPPVCVGR